MARWLPKLAKNKNAGLLHEPGKQRITLGEIAQTGGSLRIRDVSTALWFPAGQPINPVAPRGTPPRRYAYQPLANINWAGRDGALAFTMLRNFSNYSLCRAILESVLDRLCSEAWSFRLVREEGEKRKTYDKRRGTDPRLPALQKFFRKPDGWQNFRTWTRALYDDMLTIDAASIWLQRDDQERIAAAVAMDGALVFPLIDETGQQPDPGRTLVQTSSKKATKSYLNKITATQGTIIKVKGSDRTFVQGGSPAFQLTPYGYPAQEMTAQELVYAVRNRKTFRRYGFSIIEQAIAIIALGLARQDFQAAYYQSGNVPEFIAFLPPDTPPSKAEELNGYLDSILTGQLGSRRKGFFLPSYGSDKTPNIVFPKANDEVLKDSFDEWLARVLCFFFGMSPTAFIKQVNRAVGEQMAQESEEQGLQPYLDWMKDTLDSIVQDQFGWEDIEAVTKTREEQDAQKQAEIDKIHVSTGIKTLDEIRDQNGDEPYNLPETKVPVIITPTGVLPWDGSPLSNAPPPAPAPAFTPGKLPDGKPPEGKEPPPGGKKKPPEGSGPKGGKPASTKKADLADPKDSRHDWPQLSPDILSTKSHAARVKAELILKKALRGARNSAILGVNGLVARPAEKVLEAMLERLRKDEPDPEEDPQIDEISESLWIKVKPHFDGLPNDIESPLEEAALSGVAQGVKQIGIEDAGLIQAINYAATDWARNRSAELVGMSFDIEGNLIENPNPKWAITDTTREELRGIVRDVFQRETDWNIFKDELKSALGTSGCFSDYRASMIARTEIGRAQMGSALDVWTKSGMITKVAWEAVGENPCEICLQNDGEEIDFGDAFPSGAYSTLDSHPNCACLIRAVGFQE